MNACLLSRHTGEPGRGIILFDNPDVSNSSAEEHQLTIDAIDTDDFDKARKMMIHHSDRLEDTLVKQKKRRDLRRMSLDRRDKTLQCILRRALHA